MKEFHKEQNYELYQGNMLDMLEVIKPESIDSIITDPPYGLTSIVKRFGAENAAPAQYGKDGSFARLTKGFMNQEWDGSGIEYNVNAWRKCYEVLKPGGYLLAFGGTRTFHRIAYAIEDAGFEIRDTIMWLYGSGFPKSMNIGLAIDKKNGIENKTGVIKKGVGNNNTNSQSIYGLEFEERVAQNEWGGWGTALKPSYEPIIVARKPFSGSLIDNVIKYGVGGINIDECRVGDEERTQQQAGFIRRGRTDEEVFMGVDKNKPNEPYGVTIGRFPANTILTYDDTDFEEVCGGMPDTTSQKTNSQLLDIRGNNYNNSHKNLDISYERGYEDSGSASRYFYCAKASKKDRDEGLGEFEERPSQLNSGGIGRKCSVEKRLNNNGENTPTMKNIHPTVKPCDLMQYLIRLVTPNGGTILDPFNGSGSTGKAAMYENLENNKGYKYIGIDLSDEYLEISKARIEYAIHKPEILKKQIEEVRGYEELSLF